MVNGGLTGRRGVIKDFVSSACAALSPWRQLASAKWIDRGRLLVAVSPATECVRLLSDPTRLNGIKSEGFAFLWCVACGCNACKEQLGMPWLPLVNMYEQPRYAANDWCVLWWSYKGANDWKIFQLEPVNEEEEKGARDFIDDLGG